MKCIRRQWQSRYDRWKNGRKSDANGSEQGQYISSRPNTVAQTTSTHTTRASVAVLDTGKLKHALRSRGSDDTSSTGSGDETDKDGSNLAVDLARNGVGLSELVAPVTTTNGDDRELGQDDGTTDGSGNFLGALDTETDVTLEITDGDESLEAGALSGASLLLDGHDLHDFIYRVQGCNVSIQIRAVKQCARPCHAGLELTLQLGEEDVNDLVLLNGEGEEVDLLNRLDLAVLDQTTELGDWDPTQGGQEKAVVSPRPHERSDNGPS